MLPLEQGRSKGEKRESSAPSSRPAVTPREFFPGPLRPSDFPEASLTLAEVGRQEII